MEEKAVITVSDKSTDNEYISDKEAQSIKGLFKRNLKSYKEKAPSVTNREWLEQMFRRELPEISEEEVKQDAGEIVTSIEAFDSNLKSVNEASLKGISKERWLEEKLQEASVGLSVNDYGQHLQSIDDFLYNKNMELSESLSRAADGHIKMSPNLDGNIAEHMLAKTAEASAFLQGKNIRVDVREVNTSNSIDVRAVNLETGKYQNYQMKFGMDAEATIQLIERGNYDNQRIVVPTEQLDEVQAHFKAKGSSKTITDHIDAFGVKGKKFTKAEMKELQIAAQEDGLMPSMNYSHYQTKDLALSIGKNAGAMGLQAAAVTTGLNIAGKLFNGEKVEPDELVETAIKTGVDTSIKTVAAGTLQVAVRKGMLRFLPTCLKSNVIANIACVGIENVKILAKVATGDMSVTKGLDQMGRVTTSMLGGLLGAAKGTALGAGLTAWIPVIGAPLSVVTGFIGGLVGYFGGSKLGDAIYSAGKKIATAAKSVAKTVVNGLKTVGRTVVSGFKKLGNKVASLLGF